MTTTASAYFDWNVSIAADDIDHMGHVNNAVYLKWVQAAVVKHWERFAPFDALAQHLWVALKHEITYRRPAFLDDEVVASVVVESVRGARAFYATLIKRGEEVLAEVKSCWCCLDAESRQPVRIARDIIQHFLPEFASRQNPIRSRCEQ